MEKRMFPRLKRMEVVKPVKRNEFMDLIMKPTGMSENQDFRYSPSMDWNNYFIPKAVAATPTPLCHQGSVVSINQNCRNDPKRSYSLQWTELGPVLKMIAKEPLLQTHADGDKGSDFIQPSPAASHINTPSQVGGNRFPGHDVFSTIFEPAFGNHINQKPEDSDRYVVLPLNFGSSSKMVGESDEKTIALITIEKDFLKEICTGVYKSEYVLCDLLLPPSKQVVATHTNDGTGFKQDTTREASNVQMEENRRERLPEPLLSRKTKRPSHLKKTVDESQPPKKRKSHVVLNDASKVQLGKLPCCPNLPFEINYSINYPPKPNTAHLSNSNEGVQYLPFMKNQSDADFDEIQRQFESISFTKPEMKPSATLKSLNSRELPPTDSLHRRYEMKTKKSSSDNTKESQRRKIVKKPLRNNFFPRGPQPFEKSRMRVSTPVKNVNTIYAPIQAPDILSNRNQSQAQLSQLPSLHHQFLQGVQPVRKPDPEVNPIPYHAPLTSRLNNNVVMSSQHSRVPLMKPKPKLQKRNDKLNCSLEVENSTNSRTPKPKLKSPFDWLDTYFTKR